MPVVLLHILEPLEVEGEDGGQPLHPHPLVRLLPQQETVSRESGQENGNVSFLLASVADPDPGSGIGAFLTPGSGIRNRFIPDPGSRIPDPGSKNM